MKVGDKIALPNRDHRKPDYLVLLAIQDNLYYFQVIPDPDFGNYWRVIAGDNKEDPWTKPSAIDPPSGFILSVGDDMALDNKRFKIKEIEKVKIAWTITCEKI